jgi:hypothetical protein
MTLNPKFRYPIAVLLSIGNLAGVWYAARPAEPWHATVHPALAVVFALWAQRMKYRRRSAL